MAIKGVSMTEEEVNETIKRWDEIRDKTLNKIKNLEEENNKLLDVINNQDVKIADLEKKVEQEQGDYEMIDNCNRIHEKQLEQAKEIIKNLLILKNDHYGNTKMEWRVEVTEQSEQFIKEIEK